jgi:hypothetical protein
VHLAAERVHPDAILDPEGGRRTPAIGMSMIGGAEGALSVHTPQA